MEINDELIGRILRQYDAFIESGVLDDVKVEGERKLFVQGYLCSIMQRENMQKTDDSLIRSQIIQTVPNTVNLFWSCLQAKASCIMETWPIN